jgi:carboxypeptidase T
MIMKRFTIFLSVLLFSVTLLAQTQYSKVKVKVNETQLQLLASIGIDVTEGILKKGEYLICDYSEQEIAQFSDLGLNYEILIEDVSKYYADRNIGLSTNVDDYKEAGDYAVPENFEFGSMSGHATYAEIVAQLDNMVNLFPNLITVKESIGQSVEGREMWMVKISDNPNINETEPKVLYTALHHAREPVGAMQMLFYMYYLLENYDNDPFIQTLVDNTEMYFIPVVNPDGYVYNQTTNPNGGGMWRKNRRNNSGGSYGVDINRNYGYMWAYDNEGSSPYPEDETYRGTSAFSEPEIAAIRDFCESHEIVNALNYHTYANELLYAWGYIPDLCPDNDIFHAHATLMTQDNHYVYGPSNTTIYATNGSSDDWMYGEQTTKDKIFAYTPECGGDGDGFWCPINRIIPIAQENMIQNILLAAFAGSYAEVVDLTPMVTNQTSGNIDFEITRLGLMNSDFTVSLIPVGNNIISTGDPVSFTGMEILETQTASIPYTLDPAIGGGDQFKFLLSINNGSYTITDTLTKVYGTLVSLFEDDCNTIDNWTSTSWGLTTLSYHSAPKSITDSPSGNYQNNVTKTITMSNTIDLSNVAYASLNFWAKWEIETGYDYVQILISTNNGSSWTPLEGQYTVTGNGNQATGEPLYDGFQTEWVQEEIDLSDYIGNTVKFRYKLVSDSGVTEDGFYFDDFSVMVINESTTGLESSLLLTEIISDPVPNPANHSVQFNLNLPECSQDLNLKIYNAAGQQVYSRTLQSGQSSLIIPVDNWISGLYYYRLEGENIQPVSKKLMIL